jgi:hypothetical protein
VLGGKDLSERDRGDGNTDAPRVDTQYGERTGAADGGAAGSASRSGAGEARSVNGPRRVSEAQTDHGSGRRDADRGEDEERGTSWISVVIGWLTALGASLILAGIVGAVVGAILGGDQAAGQEAQSGGASGLIGLLITLLLAFLMGGYAAGRMASRSGLKHGLLVPVLALIATIFLAGIGTLLGLSFIDQLSGVTLPGLPQGGTQNLGTILTVSGILALLAPFIGGAIGGLWGARTGSHRP